MQFVSVKRLSGGLRKTNCHLSELPSDRTIIGYCYLGKSGGWQMAVRITSLNFEKCHPPMGKICLRFPASHTQVGILCPRFGSDFCQVGILCPRFGSDFCQVGILCPEIGLDFSQVGILCPRFGSDFCQVGILCPRFGSDFYQVGILCPQFGSYFCQVGMNNHTWMDEYAIGLQTIYPICNTHNLHRGKTLWHPNVASTDES